MLISDWSSDVCSSDLGRINETWFKVDRPGVYYGQCSELCGTKHGFMPIAVEVLPEAEYQAWLAAKQAAAGLTPEAAVPAAPEAAAATAARPEARGVGEKGAKTCRSRSAPYSKTKINNK